MVKRIDNNDGGADAGRDAGMKKVAELIKGIRFAMLTTVAEDGALRSRPMASQNAPFDGVLWFFTKTTSGKVHETVRDARVNVSYADVDSNTYVSLSGTAEVVQDRAKAEELWNPAYRAWFPKGLDDPELGLLKVTVTAAEYWDMPSSAMVHLYGVAKAMITGKPADPGEHRKVQVG